MFRRTLGGKKWGYSMQKWGLNVFYYGAMGLNGGYDGIVFTNHDYIIGIY